MCRLVALLADEPVLLADILTRPTTGLVRQSFASRERAQPGPGGPQQSYEQGCLNGDGYGLGWYVPETCSPPSAESSEDMVFSDNPTGSMDMVTPAVVTSMKPAWNDRNLNNLAEKVSSPLVFAHVRAAGPSLPVSDATCHPFRAGRLLFMHNGMLAGYQVLQPVLVSQLCRHPTAFRVAAEHGLIDSAVAFAFLLVELGLGNAEEHELALREFMPEELSEALTNMIRRLCRVADEALVADESLLNFVVADGQCIVACRYAWAGYSAGHTSTATVSGTVAPAAASQNSPRHSTADLDRSQSGSDLQAIQPPEPPQATPPEPPQATLYLATGTQWAASPEDPRGMYRMRQADRRSRMAILSSEPLTSFRDEWLPIPRDTFVVCTRTFDMEGAAPAFTGTVDVLFVPFGRVRPKTLNLSAVSAPHQYCCPAWGLDTMLAKTSPHGPRSGGEGGGEAIDIASTGSCEVLPMQHSRIGEAPVLCVAAVPPSGVLVVGSQDGGLRFFGTDGKNDSPEVRHHNGPVLALLVSKGPANLAGNPGCPVDSDFREHESVSTSPQPRRNSPASQLVPRVVLFSAGTNELRVWDISGCASIPHGPWQEVVCLFCFKFAPNQGRLLSITGDCELLVLGFQSAHLCSLQLGCCWSELLGMKSKSRSIRFLTFDLTRAGTPEPTQSAAIAVGRGTPGPGRFCHHGLLTELRGPHCGGIHALAYHAELRILASAGSDGLLVFWQPCVMDVGLASPRSPRCRDRSQKVVLSPADQHVASKSMAPPALRPAAHYPEGRPIYALALDETAEELFAGDATGRIRIWGLRGATNGAGLKTALGPKLHAAVLALQLCHGDGVSGWQRRWLFSGDSDGRICVCDVDRGALLQVLDCPQLSCCGSLCCLGGGVNGTPLRLACGGTAGGAHIFGGDSKGALQSLTLHRVIMADQTLAQQASGPEEHALMTSLLRELVAIQSHADRPDELHRAASWLHGVFERLLGASVRVCADGTVLARCGWEAGRPLVVLYSHYDVTLSGNWCTDPWTLVGKDGRLFGRGATDGKGPILAQVFAVRRLLRGTQMPAAGRAIASELVLSGFEPEDVPAGNMQLPARDSDVHPSVNILFVIDAAVEKGSPGVLWAVKEARDQGWLSVSSDFGPGKNEGRPIGLLATSSTWIDDEHPCVCYGMRGLIDLEVRVDAGGGRDVHSGRAGLRAEPFHDLTALLASLVDASGRVSVPGFEGKVRQLAEAERRNFERVVNTVGESQLRRLWGESLGVNGEPLAGCDHGAASGLNLLQRAWSLPTLSVISVRSGESIACGRLISCEASAIVSARTVPDQDASEVVEALKAHLNFEFAKRRTGNTLRVQDRCAFGWWEGCEAEDSKLFRAARRGVQQAWGLPKEEDVLAVREGGTMPMLSALQVELGCEAVQIPIGQASDAAHLPDECISELNLVRGVDAIWHTLLCLGSIAT